MTELSSAPSNDLSSQVVRLAVSEVDKASNLFSTFNNDFEERLAEVRGRIAKLDAIKAILDGTHPVAGNSRQGVTNAATRAAKGEASAKVLELIRAAGSDGLTRAELIDRMGVKGQKVGESSISNALVQLEKSGSVVHTPEDGKYRASA